jgi:hypothetical protein
MFKGGGGVEFSGGVATLAEWRCEERRTGRKAGGRRKENPSGFELRRVGGGGDVDVEIVDLETSGKLRRRE